MVRIVRRMKFTEDEDIGRFICKRRRDIELGSLEDEGY